MEGFRILWIFIMLFVLYFDIHWLLLLESSYNVVVRVFFTQFLACSVKDRNFPASIVFALLHSSSSSFLV